MIGGGCELGFNRPLHQHRDSVIHNILRPNRTTLQDVARLAGVSAMTVCRALKGGGRVAPKTLQVVQRAVRDSGYQPDPMLSALVRYRHRKHDWPKRASLLYLYPGRSLSVFRGLLARHQVYSEYYRGACEEAEGLGYRLEPVGLSELIQVETLQRMINARGTAGIIVAPMHPVAPHFQRMQLNVPLVALGWSWTGEVNRVAHDHHSAMLLIMKAVAQNGFRRPGLLLSKGVDASSNHMWSACFLRQVESFTQFARPLIPYNPAKRKIDLESWIRRQKPDVIISLEWLSRSILALGLPRPPSLLSVEATKESPVSGVDQNSWEVGRQSVDFLHSLISAPRKIAVPVVRLVQGTWSPGATFPA